LAGCGHQDSTFGGTLDGGVAGRDSERLRDSLFATVHADTAALRETDPKDRHVVATALKSCATTLVTDNLRDFPAPALSVAGIEVLSADAFLLKLLAVDRFNVTRVIRAQARRYCFPAMSFDELLSRLSRSVPRFAEALTENPAPSDTTSAN
jgi:hypothetical protein